MINSISIVIAVNKKDYWFTKICVASIRYYYPDVKIYLLKDELNGKFSTVEMEKYFQVELIEYPIKKFGWSASKIHFYCDANFKNKNYFVLDSDIVFIGKILNQNNIVNSDSDVIVSIESNNDPKADWFKKVYFDYNVILKYDNDYQYPNYTFNCGQLFCKGGFLDKEIMEPYFDFQNYPAWKKLDIFPLVDQSLFNYLFPKLESQGKMKIQKEDYMIWSESPIENINIQDVITGDRFPKIIHWAGAVRTPLLTKMSKSEILIFFEKIYYKKIPFGFFKRHQRKIYPFLKSNLITIYRFLKK